MTAKAVDKPRKSKVELTSFQHKARAEADVATDLDCRNRISDFLSTYLEVLKGVPSPAVCNRHQAHFQLHFLCSRERAERLEIEDSQSLIGSGMDPVTQPHTSKLAPTLLSLRR